MKMKAIVLTLGLVTAAFAMQDAVTFARSYKEGDKDTFKLNVTAATQVGDAQMTMNLIQTVKKVYENGDADLESQAADMKLSIGGSEMPSGDNSKVPTSTQRVDKFGRPVGGPQGNNAMMNQMSFMRYAGFLGGKPLKIGEDVAVDTKDETNGSHVVGSVKLDKVENGVATVLSNFSVTTKESGSKPMKMNFVTTLETATSKINKVTGNITDLPSGDQGMAIDSVKLVMERAK